MEDSAGTEAFTRQMNDLFDALNARHPAEGIRVNSPKIKVVFADVTLLDFTDRILGTIDITDCI